MKEKKVKEAIETLEQTVLEMECCFGEDDEFYLEQKKHFEMVKQQLNDFWLVK